MWSYTSDIDTASLLEEEKPVIIFKHSNRCSISDMAFRRVQGAQKDLDAAAKFLLIDVVANRTTSLQLANDLGVSHESPQVIVLKKGEVIYSASHMSIRPETILSHL